MFRINTETTESGHNQKENIKVNSGSYPLGLMYLLSANQINLVVTIFQIKHIL